MTFTKANLIILANLMILLPFAIALLGGISLLPGVHRFIGHIFGYTTVITEARRRKIGKLLGYVTVVTSAALLFFSFILMFAPRSVYPLKFSWPMAIVNVDFHLDALSVFFVLLINLIALVASWNAITYLKGSRSSVGWQQPAVFHSLVNLFHATMLLVPMVDNLIGVWIAIELTTLGSAFLVAYQGKRSSWEAAWKYLIITSTGIILALLGTMFLANAVRDPGANLGTTPDALMNWTTLMELAANRSLNRDFVKFAFLLALVGYGTKAGLAPMHTWLPDGHGEAPSPISALLSGVLLKSAFYAILRFYTLTNKALDSYSLTSAALLIAGLFSLLVAVPFILKENLFKRVLAYHSLEHMGIIAFGIGMGGPIAIFGAVLHTFNHAITKALMFLAFGNVMQQYEKLGIEQKDITGVLRNMPFTGSILILGGLALVGAPPFNVFLSEFIILWGTLSHLVDSSAIDIPLFANWVIISAVILFMLSTTLIFFGLVKHLGKLILNKIAVNHSIEDFSWASTAPLIILGFLMLLLGFWIVTPLSNLINESVIIILGKS